ncbi:MAG: hypothetical protein ACK5NA_02100 [Enterococcus sp.]
MQKVKLVTNADYWNESENVVKVQEPSHRLTTRTLSIVDFLPEDAEDFGNHFYQKFFQRITEETN